MKFLKVSSGELDFDQTSEYWTVYDYFIKNAMSATDKTDVLEEGDLYVIKAPGDMRQCYLVSIAFVVDIAGNDDLVSFQIKTL